QRGGAGGGARRFGFRFEGAPGGQQPGQAGTEGTRAQGRVTASADDRTNSLVVTGPKDVLPVVERVVMELDSNPAQESTVFVYALRNAQAARLQDVLNTLFGVSTGVRTGA